MKKIQNIYNNLSKQFKTSIMFSFAILSLISTIMSIVGFSFNDWIKNAWISFGVFVLVYAILSGIVYFIIGLIYNDLISVIINKTPVSIMCGDIFEIDGWKVIGCDTHFDTRVDDVFISKKSLHGQFLLNHGKSKEIKAVVKREAQRLNLKMNNEGLYDFPLGTVIPYHSTVDNQTYLMLAMAELNMNHEVHTNRVKFEQMLMKMWLEINRVYASNSVSLPLLGTGIARFDKEPKDKKTLLKCMLCTFKASGISLNANVKIVIFGDAKDIPLYEFKDIFKSI